MHLAPTVRLRVWDRGYFPFIHFPTVGVRGEYAALPPSPVKALLVHHPGPAVPEVSFLGCLGLS